MIKITILTNPPKSFFNLFSFYLINWTKNLVKRVLFIPNYGPSVVLASLIRGFDILGVDYQLNPRVQDISDIVCVISGVNALEWAIKAKKQRKIKKIIAGPNIVITPEDAGAILLDKAIDLVIVPSQWVKDFYASFKSGFDEKIRVWSAGVEICPELKGKKEGCLIYKKSVDKELFNFVVKYLRPQDIDYRIIKYGRYKKEKYFEILNKVKFIIYLSKSESQSLALQEGWIRDVPSFVWNKGYWQYQNYKWQNNKLGAPYLNDSCGMFFKDKNDFKNKFNAFIKNLSNFEPRKYSLENFTDEISVKNYLRIVNEIIPK